MKVAKRADLPSEHTCKQCDTSKPLDEIIVVRHRRDGTFTVRDICKTCYNASERGHRREWKRNYLARWRRRNAKLDKSYRDTDSFREAARKRVGRFVEAHKDEIAIQRRLRSRGIKVTIVEAADLLRQFGRCYPSRFGLTAEGLRECERIRSKMRSRKNKIRLSSFDIRIMVYEDGLFIKPERQPLPYQASAENLRRWQQSRHEETFANAA